MQFKKISLLPEISLSTKAANSLAASIFCNLNSDALAPSLAHLIADATASLHMSIPTYKFINIQAKALSDTTLFHLIFLQCNQAFYMGWNETFYIDNSSIHFSRHLNCENSHVGQLKLECYNVEMLRFMNMCVIKVFTRNSDMILK